MFDTGVIAGAVIAVIVLLAIAGGTTAVVVYFVVRSRSASYITKRCGCYCQLYTCTIMLQQHNTVLYITLLCVAV